MLFIAGGIAMVFGGHVLASMLDEPDELAVTAGAVVTEGPRRQVIPETAPEPAQTDPDAEWRPPPPPPPST
jgi:hypothetical protein